MPIIIEKALPAYKVLSEENIFVITKKRAVKQDIRPIEIAILNLMPTKIETETQLIRLLANSPLQINLTLIKTESYISTNTSSEHMERFYKTFKEIKNKKIDGMIITGAPVETLKFEDVDYWSELKEILDYAKNMVTSTIFICWGAQAALYHYFNIDKAPLNKKLFGVYENKSCSTFEPLLKGLNDTFMIPHSRHTSISDEKVLNNKKLKVLAKGEECGISIVKTVNDRMFFFFGHAEYDKDTLLKEYNRDKEKGLDLELPKNYFSNPSLQEVNVSWRSTGNLLFYNWLNYYVYQVTPYKLED